MDNKNQTEPFHKKFCNDRFPKSMLFSSHKQNKMFCHNWIIHVIATLSKEKQKGFVCSAVKQLQVIALVWMITREKENISDFGSASTSPCSTASA